MSTWNTVHTIDDFFDRPIRGVADYKARPHVFAAEFDVGADDYSGRYFLHELPDELFIQVMARNDIWLRWKSAFQNGHTTIETHPALPHDRESYLELNESIDLFVRSTTKCLVVGQAEFRVRDVRMQWEVLWL